MSRKEQLRKKQKQTQIRAMGGSWAPVHSKEVNIAQLESHTGPGRGGDVHLSSFGKLEAQGDHFLFLFQPLSPSLLLPSRQRGPGHVQVNSRLPKEKCLRHPWPGQLWVNSRGKGCCQGLGFLYSQSLPHPAPLKHVWLRILNRDRFLSFKKKKSSGQVLKCFYNNSNWKQMKCSI